MPNRVSREHEQKIREAWIRQRELEAEGWNRAEIIDLFVKDLVAGRTTLYNWLNADWLRKRHLEHLALDDQQGDRDWVLDPIQPMVSELKDFRARLRTLGAIAILEKSGPVLKDVAATTGKSLAEVRQLLHQSDPQLLEEVRKSLRRQGVKGSWIE